MIKKIVILFCVVFPLAFKSQIKKTDSLLTVLQKNTNDTNRVNCLIQLSKDVLQVNPDTVQLLVNQAKKLSEQLNWKKGIALSYNTSGSYFLTKKDFAQAENSYLKALHLWEELKYQPGICITLENIGLNYRTQGNFEKAFEYYMKALEVSTKANDKKGMAKVNGSLGFYYAELEKFEEAIKYDSTSINIAREIKDYIQETKIRNNLSIVYRTIGDYDKSLIECEKAMKAAESAGSDIDIARAFNSMGSTYYDQGNRPKALECHLKALHLQEKLNSKRGVIICLGNMALIYQDEKQFDKALDYYQKALLLAKELNNKTFIASLIGNIGGVYYDKSDFKNAFKYYQECLELEKANGNKSGIARQLGNIGNIFYMQGDSAEKKGNMAFAIKVKYPEALRYYTDALQIKEELGIKSEVGLSLMNIGDLYLKLKKYNESQNYFNKASVIAREIGDLDLESKCEANLSDLNSLTGNFKEAFNHLKNYLSLKDSLSNSENTRKMVTAEMNFEFDKKQAEEKAEQEKKDVIATEEKKKQRIILSAVASGLLLVLIFSLFLFNRFKVTKRQKKVIELQKIEVERQKVLVEEKQKDIVDSINYAKRIQNALLASDQLLNEHLKDYFILFMPKDIVAGDFYWATNSPEGFILVTADCTGHGVPGAFMSLLNISKLNETINQKNILRPDLVLNEVRKEIVLALNPPGSTNESKDGMDAVICKFDFQNYKLQFSCANNPVWILRDKTLLEYSPDKMPVGKTVAESKPFTLQTTDLKKGDIVYMFTDGYADQFGGSKGKKFMLKPMKELIGSFSSLTMNQQKETLHQTITQWRGFNEQVDDILVIGVRV